MLELVTPCFSIDLTVLRQLVCYQVLATLSGRCFVPFLRETFLMQVREKFKKLSQVLLCFLVFFFVFFLNSFSTNM